MRREDSGKKEGKIELRQMKTGRDERGEEEAKCFCLPAFVTECVCGLSNKM